MTETVTAQPEHAPAWHAEPFVPVGGRIVVGVDGSTDSRQALRAAAAIAELTGASIDVVAVWDIAFTFGYAESYRARTPVSDTEAMVETVLTEVFGQARPERLRTRVRFGSPVKAILDEAADADLIVVGNRGHGAVAGLLLGSVSTRCAAAARCPVLIVPGRRED
jgi:nucleotide-binding universal stress UspA family protein